VTRGRRDTGASMVEYALLVALIALVCIGAISYLGNAASRNISSVATIIGGS
jgi:pilus assembly protein Flp/PilA